MLQMLQIVTNANWQEEDRLFIMDCIVLILPYIFQLNKLVALVNAVFAKQGRKFRKDDKVLAYPTQFYSRLFNFYENMTRT